MWRWLLPGALLALTSGCPGFGDQTLAEIEGIDETPEWNPTVRDLIAQRCGSCHGERPSNGAPFPLVTYEQAVARAERIVVRAVELQTMPPGNPLPDGERALIEAWVNGGTPAGEPEAPRPDAAPSADMGPVPDLGPAPDMGPPPEDGPTWNGEIEALIAQRCQSCHSDPPMNFAPFPLVTYQQAVNQAERIRVRAVEQQTMPPGNPLPAGERARLQAWIEAGTPEE